MELTVVYEDDVILACHKPAGVASQTASLRQQDMVTLMKNYRRRRGEDSYIGLLQRLDQPVEGIIVAAKDPKTAAVLSKQLQDKKIVKEYVALIPAGVLSVSGVMEDFLVKDGKTNTSRVVAEKGKNAKAAKLSYECLSEEEAADVDVNPPEGYCAAKIHLDTGRHHQIRVQFASRKAPLLGDEKYGGAKPARGRGLGLCCRRIVLTHPVTKKPLELTVAPEGLLFH